VNNSIPYAGIHLRRTRKSFFVAFLDCIGGGGGRSTSVLDSIQASSSPYFSAKMCGYSSRNYRERERFRSIFTLILHGTEQVMVLWGKWSPLTFFNWRLRSLASTKASQAESNSRRAGAVVPSRLWISYSSRVIWWHLEGAAAVMFSLSSLSSGVLGVVYTWGRPEFIGIYQHSIEWTNEEVRYKNPCPATLLYVIYNYAYTLPRPSKATCEPVRE